MIKALTKKAARIIRLAAYDFKSAYAGSTLGVLWAVSEPLVTVAVYWFVYSVAFGGSSVGGAPYYLWLSVGIAPWFFMSNGIKNIAASFGDYSYLLKKTVFNPSVIPIVRAVSALYSHLIFLMVVAVMLAIYGTEVSVLKYLVPIFLITYIFIYTVGRLIAPICVLCKDIRNVLSVVFNVGFWLTPVFWNIDNLGGVLKKFALLNPAAIIVEGYRSALLFNEYVSIDRIIYLAVLCGIFWILGEISDKRLLPDLSDKI